MKCPYYKECKYAEDSSVCNPLGEEQYFELCPTFEETQKG